jgi:hypothetical protein
MILGPNNDTCTIGLVNLRNLTFQNPGSGVIEVRVLDKTINYKTEYNIYPGNLKFCLN